MPQRLLRFAELNVSPVDKCLFLAMFFGMRLPRLFCVASGMNGMTSRSMSVVSGLLVVPTFIMLCGLTVVMGGMGVMLGSLSMMLCGFLRHSKISRSNKNATRVLASGLLLP
jgi:hypothetical protein